MYQFYYADTTQQYKKGIYKDHINNHFHVTAVRPAMWEEHCLECSAPLCFESCPHYVSRSDGRCKRFENGCLTFQEERACCGQGVHIKFRRWANLMTIIFPAMLEVDEYMQMSDKNQKLGNKLKKIADSKLPVKARWESIRTIEFLRRRNLRKMEKGNIEPDAFVFHGFSYHEEDFNLIVEIYNEHTPLYKTALKLQKGENFVLINKEQLSKECWKPNNLVKIYPENNLEVELDILWCDFVQGQHVAAEKPADKVKCVVWDLDNTVWNGTLIETDDVETLALKPYIFDTIKELDERGIIQSVASKNDMELAWPVVEKLGIADYILYPQIHWNAKSGSMEQIARSLNIGVDALALIDDSVFEREQVKNALPQVRTYDAVEIADLLKKDEFSVIVTEESKKRRAMYKAEEKRNQLKDSGNEDTIEFLKKCNLKISVFEPKTEEEVRRCYELVVRTNQLNMSGKKYTEEEFSNVLKRENHKNFAFSCHDDFGEYGIVGYGQYHIEEQEIAFTEFAMSCRVAGKYVESALFVHLLKKEKCKNGNFEIIITKKNVLLRNTLQTIGFTVEKDMNEKILYVFDESLYHSDLVKVEGSI